MNLIDAINSGKPFRRTSWQSELNIWVTVVNERNEFRAMYSPESIIVMYELRLTPLDVIATDWIVYQSDIEKQESEFINNDKGYILVDLDGCLAEYHGMQNTFEIGAPVKAMVDRVKLWLDGGMHVKIFTARMDGGEEAREHGLPAEICDKYNNVSAIREMIQDWAEKHIGVRLEVTNKKGFGAMQIWDDRAVTVEYNTGKRLTPT